MKPKDDYKDGECPDCGTAISDEAEFGDSCPNCGHVFAGPNENCLQGMSCPKCKSKGPFIIATTCWAEVSDDGIEDTFEHEWGEDSPCTCKSCKFSSKVGNFNNADDEIKMAEYAKSVGDEEYDHPSWSRHDWRKEVVEENTTLGYFDWVIQALSNPNKDEKDEG